MSQPKSSNPSGGRRPIQSRAGEGLLRGRTPGGFRGPRAGKSIRVLIVDDRGLFRDSLTAALQNEDGIVVAAAHASAKEVVAALSGQSIDIVLLEHDHIDKRGIAVVRWAREHAFSGSILIVTAAISEFDAIWLIRNGVAGIVRKENSLDVLVKALRTVASGDVWLAEEHLKLLMNTMGENSVDFLTGFTKLERLTLKYLLAGDSNKEIAARLKTTESAVKSTVQRLFRKTGVRSRGHLLRMGLEKYRDIL